MSDILITLAWIEVVIVVLAILSNTFLTFLIHQASSLHCNCRRILIMFSMSMYFLTVSHGMTVFEFLATGQSYEYIYFVSVRGFFWRFLHEFGYSLQSLSLVLFSIERLVASICPSAYQSTLVKSVFVITSLLSIIISIGFSLEIHLGNELFLPTFVMNFIDISGCIVLLIAWKRSLRRYRSTIGIFSLEQRFQLSEVYTWSRHLIPAVLLASMCKIVVIGVIWILITGNHKGNEAALWLIVYNNVLNLYTMVLPFVVLAKHSKIREKLIHLRRSADEFHMKTLDGREIPCKHDHIAHLQESWK